MLAHRNGHVVWILVPGGRTRSGEKVADLLWSQTPALRPVATEALPLTGITHPQARELAQRLGGRLPTSTEWSWMAGAGYRRYPWGDAEPDAMCANLRGLGPGCVTPVDARPAGTTPEGVMEAAGNVWEWTITPVPGSGAVIRGGSYNSIPLYARCDYAAEAPVGLRSPGLGVRVVMDRETR